jgi:hypothetical protein
MSDNEHLAAINRIVTLHVRSGNIGDRSAVAINHHADALAKQAAGAERKVELYEWMAYQRKQRPGITDDDILRLTYVPEWREQSERQCKHCGGVGVGYDGRECMFCGGSGDLPGTDVEA